MITLLGSLLGFITSAIPQLIGLWKDYQDRKHEIAIFGLQVEWSKLNHDQKMEEIHTQGDISELMAIHQSDTNSGVSWVDGLRASVRPVITYAFFGLFAGVKAAELVYLLDAAGGDWVVALPHIWDEETAALFSAVISFWFGSRAMVRVRGGR